MIRASHLPSAHVFAIGHLFFEKKCTRVIGLIVTYLNTIDSSNGIRSSQKPRQEGLALVQLFPPLEHGTQLDGALHGCNTVFGYHCLVQCRRLDWEKRT